MCRLGVKENSVTAVFRILKFNSIAVSAGAANTWLTAVAMGPPLETISTQALMLFLSHDRARFECHLQNSAKLGMPLGCVSPAIPFLQSGAQQPEVVFVHLGRIGLGQRGGVHGFYQGMAVVLRVQAGPNFGGHLQLGTFCNGFPSLSMALQAAHQHRVKVQCVSAFR
jgi:hypothetical protein